MLSWRLSWFNNTAGLTLPSHFQAEEIQIEMSKTLFGGDNR